MAKFNIYLDFMKRNALSGKEAAKVLGIKPSKFSEFKNGSRSSRKYIIYHIEALNLLPNAYREELIKSRLSKD